MDKMLPILNVITRVLLGLVLVSALILNLGMAYIMFMPDSLPKPFYLLYSSVAGGTPSANLPAAQTQGDPAQTGDPAAAPNAADPAATETPASEVLPGKGIMLNTGTKVINLTDAPNFKYLKITIVVEFAPDNPDYMSLAEEEKTNYINTFTEELNSVLPLIDDTIITTLATKSFESLYTADGKEQLRTDLMQQIQTKLPDKKVIAVYFTDFVVE